MWVTLKKTRNTYKRVTKIYKSKFVLMRIGMIWLYIHTLINQLGLQHFQENEKKIILFSLFVRILSSRQVS